MGEQKQNQDWQKGQSQEGQNPQQQRPGQNNPSQNPTPRDPNQPQGGESGEKPYSEKEFERNPGKH
jgi:hypothetical protein